MRYYTFLDHLLLGLRRAGWERRDTDSTYADEWVLAWPADVSLPLVRLRLVDHSYWDGEIEAALYAGADTQPFAAWNWWHLEAAQVEAVLAALHAWRVEHGRPGGWSVEQAFRAARTPEEALALVEHHVTDRQYRLYACACLRRLTHVMAEAGNVHAVELMERYADEEVPKREMKKARKAAHLPFLSSYEARQEMAQVLEQVRRTTAGGDPPYLLALARDLLGEPWRDAGLRWAWLEQNGGAARLLARAIYVEDRWEDLPVLGDALEESGCTDARLLDHCRLPGEHARGCWLVDAVRRA